MGAYMTAQPIETNATNVMARAAAQGWGINLLSPVIGAEVLGIDLSQTMTPEQVSVLREILLEWKVMFFRDQDITTQQHLDFSKNFGPLEIHPFGLNDPDYPEVLFITHDENNKGKENIWHSDVTWREAPSLGSVLRAREVPEVGGDTLFADMYAAYDGLPEAMKEKIEGRMARHDFYPFKPGILAAPDGEKILKQMEEKYPNPWHPIVRTHPETGRKGLYVNIAFTVEVEGMDEKEGRALLDFLYRQATVPEYQCRFRWEDNSIAFWDNRSCQHYAASDYWPHQRRMERVTIIGDQPQ